MWATEKGKQRLPRTWGSSDFRYSKGLAFLPISCPLCFLKTWGLLSLFKKILGLGGRWERNTWKPSGRVAGDQALSPQVPGTSL